MAPDAGRAWRPGLVVALALAASAAVAYASAPTLPSPAATPAPAPPFLARPPAGARPAGALAPAVAAAWQRYLRLVDEELQERLAGRRPFLDLDALSGRAAAQARARIAGGNAYLHRVRRRDANGGAIEVPGARVEDWAGTSFVPGVSLDVVLALASDYDRYREIYAPDVLRSRLLSRSADGSLLAFLRIRRHKVATLVADTEHRVRVLRPADGRALTVADTTRVQEVEHAGSEQETLRPDAAGRLWRIRTVWRYLQRGGGVYLENESIVLARRAGFPASLLVGPLVRDAARDTVDKALRATRRALLQEEPR